MGEVAPVGDVILHEQDDEAFLLHVPTGQYFGLNRTGLVVWRALAAGRDPIDDLAGRWPDVPAEVRRADADALVEALAQAGLVRPKDDPAGDA